MIYFYSYVGSSTYSTIKSTTAAMISNTVEIQNAGWKDIFINFVEITTAVERETTHGRFIFQHD
jgi:hypothetical protein